MININNFIVLDTETTSVLPGRQLCEISAVIIDARRLEIKEQGIFTSLCRIIPDEEVDRYGLDPVDQRALQVNGLTLEQLAEAPPLRKVWADFENFVEYHNTKGGKWNAPILVAHNAVFDRELLNNIKYGLHRGKIVLPSKLLSKTARKKAEDSDLAELYRNLEPLKEPWKFSDKEIFHPAYQIDNLMTAFSWFENMKEPLKLNQVVLRNFLALDTNAHQNAHGALVDTLYTAEIFIRFLKLQRQFSEQVDFDTEGNTLLEIDKIIKEFNR